MLLKETLNESLGWRNLYPPCNYKRQTGRNSAELKNRQTDQKTEPKMAEFLTNSWRQQHMGQEVWSTPYITCYTTRIPSNFCVMFDFNE